MQRACVRVRARALIHCNIKASLRKFKTPEPCFLCQSVVPMGTSIWHTNHTCTSLLIPLAAWVWAIAMQRARALIHH